MTRAVLLGDIAKIGDGLHGTPMYDTSGSIPFINGNNLDGGKILIKSDTKMCSIKTFEKYRKNISCNTILLSINGTIGNLAKYDGGHYVLGKSACYIDILDVSRITKDYLYYLCSGKYFQEFIKTEATGTTIKNVPLKALRNFKFNLPELHEQKQITNILGTIDEKIELNRKMNKTLEQLGQALFREYFINNPEAKNWPKGKVSDLGAVITGKTPSKTKSEYFGGEIQFLKVPDMHGQSIVIKTSDSLTKEGAASQKGKLIPKYSTCVSCIATVGLVSLAGSNLQTNQQINSIIPKIQEYKFYNYLVMLDKTELIKTMASGGTATPNLNKGHFENIKVTLPPIDVLAQFDMRVANIFEKIELNMREVENLQRLRDSLLPLLISGKLKV